MYLYIITQEKNYNNNKVKKKKKWKKINTQG